MATWIYPFVKITDDIYRPWIPIQIINPKNNEFITTLALLDTGADHCVFPQFAAEQTKLDLKADALSSEKMQGLADDKIEVWKHNLKINLLAPDRKTVLWKSKEMVIGCVDMTKFRLFLALAILCATLKFHLTMPPKRLLLTTIQRFKRNRLIFLKPGLLYCPDSYRDCRSITNRTHYRSLSYINRIN